MERDAAVVSDSETTEEDEVNEENEEGEGASNEGNMSWSVLV